MRQLLTVLFVSGVLVCQLISAAQARVYSIRPLNEGIPHYTIEFDLNNNGEVVWWELYGDMYLYTGTSTINLSANGQSPQINDNGVVVWEEHFSMKGSEIFMYDGSIISQITDNEYHDDRPKINDNGDIVWEVHEGDWQSFFPGSNIETWNIYMYDGVIITKLTDNLSSSMGPLVNANGKIIWFHDDQGLPYSRLYLHDGIASSILSENIYPTYSEPGDRYSYHINDNDFIVWGGVIDNQIYIYDGTNTTILSQDLLGLFGFPKINTLNQVVWAGTLEGANTDELFFYDAGVTILLSSNSYNNGNYSLGDFDLNDTGEVVWAGFEGNNFEMFVNDGAATTQLTFNDFDDGVTNNHAQINNAGDIVWISYDQPNASTLFLAKACTGLPVKNDIHSFDSFQLAYDSAADGDTIQGYAWHFPEDLIMDQNITVTLDGGYDCDHLAKVYRSSIHGSLTISDGAVTVENIVIQ